MIMNSSKCAKIGIIGEGIMGLSVGNILQERCPSAQIQIVSSQAYKSTTSCGAVGFVCLNLSGNLDERIYKWLSDSTSHFWKLYRSPYCIQAGVTLNSFHYLSSKPFEIPKQMADLFPGFRSVETKELEAFGFSTRMKHGLALTSTLVEPRYYLPYLETQFINNGGEIIIGKINGGSQNVANWAVHNNYDIVVNCSGLGSKELFGDNDLKPLRGQIVRVDAPWFKHSFMTTDDTYAFSCRESVALGTVRQTNDWDVLPRAEDTNDILKRVSENNLCLSKSKVVEEWTGLRPCLPRIRLEIEYLDSSKGAIPVVHNYGHTSSGISLSWGTSLEAASLVESVLMNMRDSNL